MGFLKVLRTEAGHMLNLRFWACSLLFAACIFGGAFEIIAYSYSAEAVPLHPGENAYYTYWALGKEYLQLALPILAVLPFAGTWVTDIRNGFHLLYLPRSGRRAYVFGKLLICAAAGFLVTVIGTVIGYLLVTCAILPCTDFSKRPEESITMLLLGTVVSCGLMGACLSAAGLALSLRLRNVFAVYSAPFVLYEILILVQERYARGWKWLNPKHYLKAEVYFAGKEILSRLILCGVLLLLSAVFAWGACRRLKGRTGQVQLRERKNRTTAAALKPARRFPMPAACRAPLMIAAVDFHKWKGSSRIRLSFVLCFILCALLTEKAGTFALQQRTTLQAMEPFIWAFGDPFSVLVASLLLILILSDVPSTDEGTPFLLARTDRTKWLLGQALYVAGTTVLFVLCVLIFTVCISMPNSFAGNMWSPTAAILGYSGAGKEIVLPTLLRVLEFTRPYPCAAHIFFLMLCYMLFLGMLMMCCKLRFGNTAGVAAALGFSLYGFLLNPELFRTVLKLSSDESYIANVAVGWLSPLNQATYHMHSFGYDLLPKLWQTYLLFGLGILLLFILSVRAMSRYNFTFTGTENRL